MHFRFITFLCLFQGWSLAIAQGPFPPAAGMAGSTAIPAQNNSFTRWASEGKLERGWIQITDTTLGKTSIGDTSDAFNAADSRVVSLGDGGRFTYKISPPLIDHPGFDFAIFENALNDSFLELATVEVSSDGILYYAFPSVSLTDTLLQTGSFGYTQPTQIHHLAGKYKAGFGTPFDLSELSQISGLNTQRITHIRITDVVGCVNCPQTAKDKNLTPINDPWPTPFPSSGFDLDALGIMDWGSTDISSTPHLNPIFFPNPFNHYIQMGTHQFSSILNIYDVYGKWMGNWDTSKDAIYVAPQWPEGIYYLKSSDGKTYPILKCKSTY